MKNYIDKNELLKRIVVPDEQTNLFQVGLATARSIIESMPTVDVEPIVYGKWEYSHTDHVNGDFTVVKCSICEYQAYAISLHVYEGNYCSNCGAKMENYHG